MTETLTRSITGLLFIALVVLSFLFTPYLYLGLFSLILAGAWLEYSRMFPEKTPFALSIPISALLASCFILVFFVAGTQLSANWLLLPLAIITGTFLISFIAGGIHSRAGILFTAGGMLYLGAGFSMMHLLAFPATGNYTPRWILFTFYFLWMNDTMAFASGRLTGKHPFWPAVSPGKTWEGSIGGAVFTILLSVVFGIFFRELSMTEWIVFAIITILFGSLGDLIESWMKRKAGVKDSGRLLPGHGGILDRFDSFLLAVPFIAFYIKLIL